MIPQTELEHLPQDTEGLLMSTDEARTLADYAGKVPQDQEIVEVGSWAGGSAAWLGAGSRHGKGAHITCIDIWTDWLSPPPDRDLVTGRAAFDRFTEVTDPTRTTALKGRSLDVAKMWTRPVGMLFIDASHTFKDCAADYRAWAPFVVPGGVLAVHDYAIDPPPELWWTEGPTKAVTEVVIPDGKFDFIELVGWTWIARRV